MSFFKTRTDYFKGLATNHKLVGHDQFVNGSNGPKRKSFHRINDEDELMAACVKWAHFPCVVHTGYDGRYSERRNEVKKRKITNSLMFLDKAEKITDMGDRESAHDNAYLVMEDFVSRMLDEFEEHGYCCNFQNIDLSMFSFEMIGPIGTNLFGWHLSFIDEQMGELFLKYDATKWYE